MRSGNRGPCGGGLRESCRTQGCISRLKIQRHCIPQNLGQMPGRNGELIQLTRKGVVFSGSAADLRALRAQFQRDHYIILPKLIEPDLLATILKHIEAAPSVKKEYDGIIAESISEGPLTHNLF